MIVAPGTLVVVEGTGFGQVASVVRLGNLEIENFLSWQDTFFHYRLPEAIPVDTYVEQGSVKSPVPLQPAPEGTIKLIVVVDSSKVTVDGLSATLQAKLTTTDVAALFKPPLYFKGGFHHSEGTFGYKDDMWGGGAKWRMYNPRGTLWVTECLFTPEAIKTYLNPNNYLIKPMVKFAFEDGNLERNIGEFESDFAFTLRKSFQKNTGATGNDPIAYLQTTGKKSGWAMPKDLFGPTEAVVAAYPVVTLP